MMIVPLASAVEWDSVWKNAPAWNPPCKDVLFIAPHPDDETLAAGGFLSIQAAAGVRVQLVAVTDGERAYENTTNLGPIRRAEQLSAVKHLGIDAHNILRLNISDSCVGSHEGTLVQNLLPLTTSETHILAPWTGDFHPDHEACGRAAAQVARLKGAALTFYFFWTWHRGTPALVDGLPLRSLSLSSKERRCKEAALAEYTSQTEHDSGQPILAEQLLWPARQPSEIFLPL